MNNCTFSGRIASIERVAYGTEGKNLTRFCISIRKRGKDSNGYPNSFLLNCTAFGSTGDNISKYFAKGDSIIVIGELSIDAGKDDKKYTSLTVNAFDFCGTKSDSSAKEESKPQITAEQNSVAPTIEEAPSELPFDF